MKEMELRAAATCCVCQRNIGATQMPIFWRVRVERFGLDMKAINRQTGLAMLLGGNGLLAHAMGSDEDLAVPVMEPVTVTVCEECGTREVCVAQLVEMAPQENAENTGDGDDSDE